MSGLGRFVPKRLVPQRWRALADRLDERIAKIPTELNECGYDRWGLYPEGLHKSALPLLWLYENYFRTKTFGVEQLPAGRMLLVANHAGQLPFDAAMIACAVLMEAEPPRVVRGMAEFWVSEIPFFSVWASRGGAVAGTPETCREMLEAGEAVLAFPEGVRGMNKLYRDRYQLQRFGEGFARLAIATDTPVVPVAVVGSEEQQPGIANWRAAAKLLRMPAFPITPTFPLLGPLGLWPLPVRYRIYFGEPMRLSESAAAGGDDVTGHVESVRKAIDGLLERGRRDRRGVFH